MGTLRLQEGAEGRFYLLGDKPHELRLRGAGIECNLLEMMRQPAGASSRRTTRTVQSSERFGIWNGRVQ